jgi:hypothetical protein
MNKKGCGRKLSWPNLRYYTGIYMDREKTYEKTVSIAGLRVEI